MLWKWKLHIHNNGGVRTNRDKKVWRVIFEKIIVGILIYKM